METLKLKNVSQFAQDCMKTLSTNAKGVTVPVRGIIEFTEAEFNGNSDVHGKIRLGIFRPVPPIPEWAIDTLRSLGVSV